MPKVLVSRWKKKRQVYASPVKELVQSDHQSELLSLGQSEEIFVPEEVVITNKARIDRPPKIGRALELDTQPKSTNVSKIKVNRLINFQPRNVKK